MEYRVRTGPVQVATRLPPSVGRFAGWRWDDFFLAILTVLDDPASNYNYQRALATVRSLPAGMRMTWCELTAAWARFMKLYPRHNSGLALKYMYHFLQETGRLTPGGMQHWYNIEFEWQALEGQGDDSPRLSDFLIYY